MIVDIDLNQKVDNSYQIHIGALSKITVDKKVAIITNETVAALHLDTLIGHLDASDLTVIKVKDGEQFKTLETVEFILNELFKNRFDRKSMLIAFGGGVIGDMTGFVASIYQRGIEFVQIPTTLLSMVDASVGGKTGVNSSFGKNLIGAFYQPKAVYIDPSWLKSLPKREFGAGVAEIVKMAATLDKQFFEWLETADLYKDADLIDAIAKSVKLKADIVAQDEKESGIRQVLNYGHTFAHVIEQETMYAKYLHGECVAYGMVMANRLALSMDLIDKSEFDRVNNLLSKYGLDLIYKTDNIENFYDRFFLDKKSFYGKITFIVPNRLGGYKIVNNVSKDLVLKAIDQ